MQIKDLKPAGYNPRKITEEKLQMLAKAMREFGDLSGIVFNCRTGNLIGGHQRVKNFDPAWEVVKEPYQDGVGTTAEGHIETPFGKWKYREVDWPKKKEAAANIAANKHGAMWDFPKLADILIELDTGAFDMELTGFSDRGLEKLMTYAGPEAALMDKITSEKEYKKAKDLGAKIIKQVTNHITHIANTSPGELNNAIMVVVNKGQGNNVIFLADPNTKDLIVELQRYADAGEQSPLEMLTKAIWK